MRHLLVLARAAAAGAVDWAFWRETAGALPSNHPTIARSAELVAQPVAGTLEPVGTDDPIEQLVAVIRQRNYSIRTEEAYRGWLARFVGFIKGSDPGSAGAREVKSFQHVQMRRMR